jgi:23S rRNA (guanosine2251-2'-O)-methyltransferase
VSPARKSPRTTSTRGPKPAKPAKSSRARAGSAGPGATRAGGKAKAPRSAAADKAIAARQARHAAASVRKADRPGGASRAAGRGPASGRRTGDPLSTRRTGPKGLGGDQVEGRQAVRELLLAGTRRVREVWIAADQDDSAVLDDIAELAQSVGVPVQDVTRTRLNSVARTESPQGVLARAAELPETDLEALVATPRGGPPPFLLATDGITDPGNLGALLRSAECAGVTGVVLPRHRAVHITPTVTKAAAGSIEYLRFALVGGLPTAIRALQDAGVWVVGLDAGGARPLFDLDVADRPIALVLGAEGAGLSRLVRERCDEVVSIPLGGQLGSLNVAAAGAVACFEVARRRRSP